MTMLDTLAIARDLCAVGFPQEQAEALATAVGRASGQIPDLSHLATKADVEALRTATKADIETLRVATKTDIEALRTATKADLAATKLEIIKWIVGIAFAALVINIGAMISLVQVLHSSGATSGVVK